MCFKQNFDNVSSLHYDLNNKKVQYLIRTDERLASLIKYIKDCDIVIEKDGFRCIVKYIIGQQISDKARESIWLRFCSFYDVITPEKVLITDDNKLKSIGLSLRKVSYINFDEFSILENKEIIKKLTKIRGIGQWTAEMYLIFSLGRENVLSAGDGTIQRVIQWMYNLVGLPSSKDVVKYFNHWNQYATIVSAYFWKSIEIGLLKKPFEKITSI